MLGSNLLFEQGCLWKRQDLISQLIEKNASKTGLRILVEKTKFMTNYKDE